MPWPLHKSQPQPRAWKDIPVAEREQFKARTKEEIQEIEQWMLASPNRPIYLRIADGPVFAFRRFSDEEFLAIQQRLPKSEAEAAEQVLKDPTVNDRERDAEIADLEACSLDPYRHEAWVGMDWRDRLALWAELLALAQKREENVVKFRPHEQGAVDGESMLPLPTLPSVATGEATA